MAEDQPMILDTCALLWLVSGSKKLSRPTIARIGASPVVYVSAISGFEIAIKVAKGKLKLPFHPQDWFEKAVIHHNLTVLPLTLDVCIGPVELPTLHDDPCDRFIIAAAKLKSLTVVTSDEQFERYGVTVIR